MNSVYNLFENVKIFSFIKFWDVCLALFALLMSVIQIQAQSATNVFINSADSVGGWQFSWSDEFNGPTVDPATWGYEIGYVRNNEAQYYTSRTENSRIDNGNLLIQALRDNWSGHAYTSASRITSGKKSFLYGKFEMRAKIDIRQGSWPAWWWLPNTGGWPKGGEIDMMEYYKNKCLFNVMNGNAEWFSQTRSISGLGGDLWAANFHVWTMVWDSTKIDLLLDGTLINHFLLSNADGTGPNEVNPFRQPGYMIVNQAIGGTNGGDPSNTTFPVNLRIDWIRVYKWINAASYKLTVKGGVGTGSYIPGTQASITALMPASGMVFDKWVVTSGNLIIADSLSPSTVITIPSADATVTATYTASTYAYSDHPAGVKIFELSQNYPNPFNPNTLISYQLPANSYVSIKIYDILGRELETLVNQSQNPGKHIVIFNAEKYSSGVYFYEINAIGSDKQIFNSIKKMILIK